MSAYKHNQYQPGQNVPTGAQLQDLKTEVESMKKTQSERILKMKIWEFEQELQRQTLPQIIREGGKDLRY